MATSIRQTIAKIKDLRTEAAETGDDEQIIMCDRAIGHELRNSDTTEPLSHIDLGISIVRYVELICESLDATAEGHVRLERCGEPPIRLYAA
jgi:hypothetical protein